MPYRDFHVKDYGQDNGYGRYHVTIASGKPDGQWDVNKGTNDTDEIKVDLMLWLRQGQQPDVAALIRENEKMIVAMVNKAMGLKEAEKDGMTS